jgi:hypothetical protein
VPSSPARAAFDRGVQCKDEQYSRPDGHRVDGYLTFKDLFVKSASLNADRITYTHGLVRFNEKTLTLQKDEDFLLLQLKPRTTDWKRGWPRPPVVSMDCVASINSDRNGDNRQLGSSDAGGFCRS